MKTIVEEQFSDEVLDEFVRVANKAADAAGTLIKEFFWNPKLIQTFNKRDQDGVIIEQATSADLATEDAITSVILQNFPDHLIFGEERGWLPEERLADFVWVIDPIDGTTSFKNGVPLFGTLIALLHKSKPILGIIDQPILQKRWVGVQGRPTIMGGLPVRTRPCEQLSQATLYASSPLHFSDEERDAFNRLTEKKNTQKHINPHKIRIRNLQFLTNWYQSYTNRSTIASILLCRVTNQLHKVKLHQSLLYTYKYDWYYFYASFW